MIDSLSSGIGEWSLSLVLYPRCVQRTGKEISYNKIWLIFQLTTFDYAYLYRLCCDDLRKQVLKMKNYNIEIREFDRYVGYDGR